MTPRVPPLRSAERQVVVDHGFATNQAFQPLPTPTGPAPYRLDLETVLGSDKIAAIRQAGALCWHTVGDVGGVKSPQPQQIVADTMARDYTPASSVAARAMRKVVLAGQRGVVTTRRWARAGESGGVVTVNDAGAGDCG